MTDQLEDASLVAVTEGDHGYLMQFQKPGDPEQIPVVAFPDHFKITNADGKEVDPFHNWAELKAAQPDGTPPVFQMPSRFAGISPEEMLMRTATEGTQVFDTPDYDTMETVEVDPDAPQLPPSDPDPGPKRQPDGQPYPPTEPAELPSFHPDHPSNQ